MTSSFRELLRWSAGPLLLGLVFLIGPSGQAADKLELAEGDHVVVIGNTLAERMQYFPHFETLLQARFPELKLVVRDMGWSADEVATRPRSQDFQDHGHKLEDHQPDVILALFGFNESFGGEAGLAKFRSQLDDFIKKTTSTDYGRGTPTLVLVSPIPHENLKNPHLPDGSANNKNIELYAAELKKAADAAGILCVDVYAPMKPVMEQASAPLTINGIHLNDAGNRAFASVLDEKLFGPVGKPLSQDQYDRLYAAVAEKCKQFFYDYRAVNGFYIYGGRKAPFGVINFPAEFEKLRKMIAVRDQRIWDIAAGKEVSGTIDDSSTGDLRRIETNVSSIPDALSVDDSVKAMKLPDGFVIECFADEKSFPDLQKPVAFAFDGKGRLWVATMPSYPMYLPGTPPNDKILILEDTDGDGKADKQTVFADKLHIPTGIALGYGGCFVAQQPNLMFLKDTNGDDVADERKVVLTGFDTADSHHSISAFAWGPGGELYFQEGTFHHTGVETPYGPQRLFNAGVFRYEPRTERFEVFVSYGFANPWGHTFDKWGQNFVADASGGSNYYGTAFSGQVDHPRKHSSMKEFIKTQWRPTCGCKVVDTPTFPETMQGDFLLNNTIGFLGTLTYKMKDEGSGFHGDPAEPLLRSSDPNFRPVDITFGPDGALYLCDWFNPLIGHMQHSLRDPNRDKTHGRIWRIRHKDLPLMKVEDLTAMSTPDLVNQLRANSSQVRELARHELWSRPETEVLPAVAEFVKAIPADAEDHEHAKLEALWVYQGFDTLNEPLLTELLASSDPRARAAATRVVCYQRHLIENPLSRLQTMVNDEHPRVRLEAIRALSFFSDPSATDIAYESLAFESDYYLEYTLKETLETLNGRVKAGE